MHLIHTAEYHPQKLCLDIRLEILYPYTPSQHWTKYAADREACFLKRHFSKSERLEKTKRKLAELNPGDNVYIQDQTGPTPRKWSKSGVILQSLPHNSFLLKVDGSGRTTRRNRQFLRKFTPFAPTVDAMKNQEARLSASCTPEVSSVSLWSQILDTPLTVASSMLDHSFPSISN